MFQAVLFLIVGLILLMAGGNYLVEGGVSIAQRLRLSPLLIGMTIVAFGTSAPELLVSLKSAIQGISGIALGNVIGSNIANIGFILGLTALISPITTNRESIIYNGVIMIASASLFMLFAFTNGIITHLEGIILFALLIVFTTGSIVIERKKSHSTYSQINNEETTPEMPVWVAVFVIIGSCFALSYGADLLIKSATDIAKAMHVSDRIIGLTIVSIGTSLPELAASLIAAIKKQMDISIGNIIGSNIFNVLCVLGISATVSPISVDWNVYLKDSIFMIAFSVLLVAFTLRKGKLGRIGGLVILMGYIYYIYSLFI